MWRAAAWQTIQVPVIGVHHASERLDGTLERRLDHDDAGRIDDRVDTAKAADHIVRRLTHCRLVRDREMTQGYFACLRKRASALFKGRTG